MELLVSLALLGLAALSGLRSWRQRPLLCVTLWLLPLVVVGLGMLRGQLNGSSDANLQTCQENLRGLKAGLDRYAGEHGGQLPDQLQDSGAVPSCPAAGRDTYSAAYAHAGDGFTLLCQGSAHGSHFYDHPRCQDDYPRYDPSAAQVVRWPGDSP